MAPLITKTKCLTHRFRLNRFRFPSLTSTVSKGSSKPTLGRPATRREQHTDGQTLLRNGTYRTVLNNLFPTAPLQYCILPAIRCTVWPITSMHFSKEKIHHFFDREKRSLPCEVVRKLYGRRRRLLMALFSSIHAHIKSILSKTLIFAPHKTSCWCPSFQYEQQLLGDNPLCSRFSPSIRATIPPSWRTFQSLFRHALSGWQWPSKLSKSLTR